jgi:hypothetical protein
MRGQVFKQGCTVAAESPKVPLEIVSNPTILSDDDLFSEVSDPLYQTASFSPLFAKACLLCTMLGAGPAGPGPDRGRGRQGWG